MRESPPFHNFSSLNLGSQFHNYLFFVSAGVNYKNNHGKKKITVTERLKITSRLHETYCIFHFYSVESVASLVLLVSVFFFPSS